MIMELNVYAVTFWVSILMLMLLLVVAQNRNITYYLLAFATITISNLGYYSISTAETLETALVGNWMQYLGGIYIPIFIFFSTMQLCRMEVPKWLLVFLSLTSMVVLHFVLTIGENPYYYKSVQLGFDNGVAYLIKDYGPVHGLYMLQLYGCVLGAIAIILYSFFTRKNVPHQVTFCMMFIEIISVGGYLLRRFTASTMEWTAIAYIIAEGLLVILIRRIGRYEVAGSIANSLDENSTHAYIVFDRRRRFMGCNDKALEYLPEVKNQRIDGLLDKEKTPVLYEHVGEWLSREVVKEDQCLIKHDGYIFECTLKVLHPGKSKSIDGYMLEVVDVTYEQKYLELLNGYSDTLEQEVQEKTLYANKLQERIVLGIADMVESRDTNTGGHIKRTSEVIRIFAKELKQHADEYGFSKTFLRNLVKAAPMHDLGKIAVEDRILRKPGAFTDEEYEEMKMHSEKGAEIVAQILKDVEDKELVQIAINVAHYHHEKWNGEGYPEGLSREGIPKEARIMALADVFDTLVSKRCYKEKMSYDEAFQIIEDSLGSHFDPEFGKLFLRCRTQLEEFYDGLDAN